MANTRRTFTAAAAAALTLAGVSLAVAAGPASNAEHDRALAQKNATPSAAAAAQRSTTDFDAQIAHLRAIRERLSRAKTPEEQRALMDERMKVMQDMMAGMRQMRGKNKVAQTSVCQGMLDQHVDMMQEMMQMMMDGQGMGGGMGSGMGGMMPR